jgi:hypothetical protein
MLDARELPPIRGQAGPVPSPVPLVEEVLRVRVVRFVALAVPDERRVAGALAVVRRGVGLDVVAVAAVRAGAAVLAAAGVFGGALAGAFAVAALRRPPSAASCARRSFTPAVASETCFRRFASRSSAF